MIGVVLAVCLMAAQDPGSPYAALYGEDPTQVELARRMLCLASPEELDVPVLAEMLDERASVASPAASVLVHHAVGEQHLRTLLARREPALQLVALDLATTAELQARLEHRDPLLRVGAMHALEDRGALRVEHLAALLGDPSDLVVEAALGVLLYERAPFPVALLESLSGHERILMIEALSQRPRAAAGPWLQQLLAGESLDASSRLLAIAALPAEMIDLELAREVVAAAADPDLRLEIQSAAMRLPPRVADSLVGVVHSGLQAGLPLEVLLSCLHNASDLGEKQVLALLRVLPNADAERICSWLAARGSTGLDQHIVDALEAEEPIAAHLLRRSAPFLVTPARVQRVVDALEEDNSGGQSLAFYTLAQAGVFRPEMLAYAEHTDVDSGSESWSDRARRFDALISLPIESLPDGLMLRLLDDVDVHVRTATARKLATVAFDPDVGRALLRMCGAGTDGMAAGRALTLRGEPSHVEQMWRGAEREMRVRVIDWLLERPRPWVAPLLRSALVAAEDGGDSDLQRPLLWALATLGDEPSVDRLLALIPEMPPGFLHRCADSLTRGLRERHVPMLRDYALGTALSESAREEVVRWIAVRTDLPVQPILAALYEPTQPEEIRFVALSGLLRGPGAAAFHELLHTAMARPLDGDTRELAYHVIGAAPIPLRKTDLVTIGRLLLVAPLADPENEAADSALEFPRSGDYPMHIPMIDLLRRDENADLSAFDEVAAEIDSHPQRHALSGRRLGHLLSEVARFPELRARLGPFLARLISRCPERDKRYAGIAQLILAEDAEDAQDWDRAATHYAAAAHTLLRRRLPSLVERAMLGDSSVSDGLLPGAAMVARGPLCRARALADEDPATAARHLATARELGEGDHAIELEVAELSRRIEK